MEKQKEEVDVTKGLMKHTKAQLVEIILRKDDRERELINETKNLNRKAKDLEFRLENAIRDTKGDEKTIKELTEKVEYFKSNNFQEEINRLKEDINNKNNHIKTLMFEKNSIQADFEKSCDDNVTEVTELKQKVRMCTLACYIMAAVAIIALLLGYMGI